MKIQCKDRLIDFQVPKIMGILNITADSFYDGGRYNTRDIALQQVDTLLEEGADCIDVGAASSRPGAAVLTAEEEGQRLYPILEALVARFPDTLFSVDTYNSGTAVESVARGAALINDISGGTMDPKMLSTVGKLKVPYIMTHLQGTPQNMQQQPQYENVVTEVLQFFSEKVQTAYAAGIDDVIVDPGFRFGKTIEHNYVRSLRKRPVVMRIMASELMHPTEVTELLEKQSERLGSAVGELITGLSRDRRQAVDRALRLQRYVRLRPRRPAAVGNRPG